MTNADRIRNMYDEKLAEFLGDFDKEICIDIFCRKLCDKRIDGDCSVEEFEPCPYCETENILDWLQAESEE